MSTWSGRITRAEVQRPHVATAKTKHTQFTAAEIRMANRHEQVCSLSHTRRHMKEHRGILLFTSQFSKTYHY